ncbi:serine hydrolase domain-containing protein [Aliikangiella sp. IMCC44359]|uniref:serine hydrolase domain-containing protein n=1 Tax=Aliikangiella sp. IMCC44359 TaxID=3459125 RepID=UPI00403B027E
MSSQWKLAFIISIFMSFSGCGGSSSSGTLSTPPSSVTEVNWSPISTDSWIVGDATVENFDVEKINAAYVNAANSNVLNSLLIIRNNKLIAEAYFKNTTENTLMHERSVTKTIIAMLIGIAIEEGFLTGLNQSIGRFFETEYPDLSLVKKDITLLHLLTMTSGFQWNESQDSEYINWANSSDPQGHLLNRNMTSNAGEQFNYNSAAVHLLSVILTKSTGMNTLEYAKQKLFEPLGINQIRWEILADGYYNGGAGLELRSIDLAKIGLLLHNNGHWEQQMIIPESWVQAAKSQQISFPPSDPPMVIDGYGYLWWLGHANNHQLELAWGWGGQFIVTIPDKNMVLITNSKWQINGATARSQYSTIFNILVNDIIAAAN